MTLDELKSLLWGAAVLLRGKINATGYKEYIFPLVFFKRISDVHEEEYAKALDLSGGDEEFARQPENYSFAIPDKCLWRDIREVTENVGQALVTTWTRIEQANPERVVGDRVVEGLVGIFGKRDHWTNKNILTDATLSELLEHFSKIDLSLASCPADEMGQAYEYLVGKFADDAGNTAQEFYTNRTVVELMAEILEPRAGESIYDPTCGTGGMLISCIARCKSREENWREIKAYGQEQNALTSSVARMNLFLHGVEEFRIVNDDTLLRPGFLDAGQLKTFDVVLANPPYSIKQWNRELFTRDPFGRNFLGTPPQGRADYAFIQHILKSMNPKTGRCAILLPHGVLFREEEKHIRKALIEADLVEAVIGLAPNLFYNSPMEACVMVCRMDKPAKAKGRILFLNAVGEVTRKNAESKLEARHIEKILAAYRDRASDGAFAYDATLEEIAAKDWSLAISLYAHQSATPDPAKSGRGRDLAALLGDYGEAAKAAGDALEGLAPSFGASFAAPSLRGGAVPSSLVQSSPILGRVKSGDAAAQKVKFDDIATNCVAKKKPTPEDAAHYIGLEHIDPGTFAITRWGGDVAPIGDKLIMKKGDVLFGRRRAYQRKVAIAPFDGIFSAHGMVLRPKTDVVDAHYFPFFIASDQFMDEAVRISVGGLSPTINWKTLKECEFTLPPLPRQRELAELLWAANDLKEAYKKAIIATDEMLKAKFREMFGDSANNTKKWPMPRLGESLMSIDSGKSFVCQATPRTGDFPGILKLSAVTYGHYQPGENKAVNSEEEFYPENEVQDGDLLFTRKNTEELVGVCAYVEQTPVRLMMPDTIFRLNTKDCYERRFLGMMLNHPDQRRRIQSIAGGTNSSMVNISKERLANLEMILPPLSLQREFVAIAEKAEAAKASLKQSISTLDQVMKGLING